MNEGREVRIAMNGPDLDHDNLIGHLSDCNDADHRRASSAGETRASIKAWLEETGMNSKARSVCASILKQLPKDDDQHKAMDIIMSLEAALPMVKAHVSGQGTATMELKPAAPSYGPDFDPSEEAS